MISPEEASMGALLVHDEAEPVAVGEAGHVADVGQGAGGD